jgi:thiol:disulfide interchange protein DsbC
MLRKWLLLLLLLFFLLPSGYSFGFSEKGQDCSKCHTLSSSEAKDLLKDLIPNSRILEIRLSPVKGLFEVYLESGGRKGLVYIDFPKKHFLSGSLVSIAEKKNLTQDRMAELNKVDLSQIPLDDAVVMGDPKAKLRVILFDDPD